MTKKLLPARVLCERYSVVDRTIDRWVEVGILPEASVRPWRGYWDEAEIEQLERERVAKAVAAMEAA